MWIAVIPGYFLSAAFAYCGVMNLAMYIAGVQESTSYAQFVKGLPEAGWPLAVGMLLYVLVQIAILLERRAPQAELSSSPAPMGLDSPLSSRTSSYRSEQESPKRPAAQEVYFRMQPPPPLPEAATPTPQHPAPSPKSSSGDILSSPEDESKSQEAGKQENLSFFRID